MENIKVFVRVRPLTAAERSTGVGKIVQVANKTQLIVNKAAEEISNGFTFTEVFDEKSQQNDVFEVMLRPIVSDVLQGYNCTLFAYGSSGSGKTYTMIGDASARTAGMVPRTICEIFGRMDSMNVEFTVRISYLEIFNEELIDLFAASGDNGVTLKIYENAKGLLQVNGLTEILAPTAADACDALYRGQQKMKNGIKSLRSHSIFTIMVYIKEKPKRRSFDSNVELLKFSKFSLVELAGSESAYKSGSDQSARFKVNQSLVSFNRVVQALIAKSAHIPYRDSKMTRILQESLGGNSKTSFIATISPGENATEETMNTLEYVTRAKSIFNRPQINERLNKTVLLKDIDGQINRLKQDILANRTKTGRFLTDESYTDSVNQLNTSIHHVQKGKSELDMLNDQYERIQELFSDLHLNLQQHNHKIKSIHGSVTSMRRQMVELKHRTDSMVLQIDRLNGTECKLLNQSSTLQSVVDDISVDTQQLHASIDRRSNYERQLEQTCKRFASNVKRQLDGMVQFIQLNATMVENMLSSYATKYEKFHQVIVRALENYTRNTDTFLKAGALSERSAMLAKTVEMAQDVHDTIVLEQNAPEFSATDFDSFARCYREQVENFARAQQDIHKMIALGIEATNNFVLTMETKLATFRDNMRTLISTVNIIDEANAANEQISKKLLKMYDQIYAEVKSVSGAQLPERLAPIMVECEKQLLTTATVCDAELASHKLQIEKAAKDSQMKFDVRTSGGIIENIEAVLQEGQQVEDTFAANVLKTHASAHSNHSRQFEAMTDEMQEKQLLLTGDDRVEHLRQNFEAKSMAATKQNIEGIDLMNGLRSTAENFTENTAECIRQCGNDLRQFREKGFRAYESTGGTPIKRNYKANVRLVATEPHEQIKEEICRKIAQGMSLDCSIVDE